MAIVLSVLSSLLVGLSLVIAPWTAWWDANYLIQPHPAFKALLLSAFTRGAVSGLGLINIMLAVYEAHEHLADPDDAV